MPCYTSDDGSITICMPTVTGTKFRYLYCPKCKQRRRVAVKSYKWYGPSATCTAPRRRWKHVVEPCGYVWQFD